jgi:hypothetical protein
VLHVRAGADPTGADGSQGRPYASIAAAARLAGPDGYVLVAPGVYPEWLVVTTAVHIVGVCASRVIVENVGAMPGPAAIVAGRGSSMELRGVTVRSETFGLVAEEGAQATIRAVRIDRARGHAILAVHSGSSVTGEDLVLIVALPGAGPGGNRAVEAQRGTRIVLGRTVIATAGTFGARASGEGASIELSDSYVRDAGSYGLLAVGGAAITARRTVVERSHGMGVFVSDEGTTASLSDVVVRDTAPDDAGQDGLGVFATKGASLTMERGLVERATYGGAGAIGATLELVGSVVRGTIPGPDTGIGFGIGGSASATLALRGVIVDGCIETGVGVGQSSQLTGERVVVRNTVPGEGGVGGVGLTVSYGGQATVREALFEDNTLAATVVISDGRLEIRDARIAAAAAIPGHGMFLRGGMVDAERISIAGGHGGVFVLAGEMRLVDASVRGTRPVHEAGIWGRAVMVQGGRGVFERVVVQDSVDTGFGVHGLDSEASLVDVLVEGVEPGPLGFGTGLAAMAGATMQLERVAVERANGGGVLVGPTTAEMRSDCGRVDAVDVWVRATRSATIGLDFDLFDETGLYTDIAPRGRPIAAGLYAGPGCVLEAQRAVVTDGGYGFAVLGSLVLRDAVIAAQADAAGARRGGAAAIQIERVSYLGNASDEIRDDSALPESAALQEPTPVCIMRTDCP